ncbi:Acetyltransferase [Aureococcus anophagefferens]|nr:Acetyltransferase [Aureococcus anophagefferens]
MGSRASAGSSNGRNLRQQLLLLCITFARINGLVPFAEHAALRPWLDSQSFGCIAGEGGALRPRLASLDDGDPIVLGVMEGSDVDGVAKLLAASFAPSVVVEYSGGEAPTWEDAALGAVASAARSYDVAEYAFGLRARCGARLRRPEVAGASTATATPSSCWRGGAGRSASAPSSCGCGTRTAPTRRRCPPSTGSRGS